MYLVLIIFIIIIISVLNTGELFNGDIEYVNIDDYDVKEIPNFLSNEECSKIIELTNGKLVPSKIYSDKDDVYSTNHRLSDQVWLYDYIDPMIKNISDRVRQYTNTFNRPQEPLQVVNYPVGGFFRPHYDACEGNKEFCKRLDKDTGPRLFTVLFYLNDNFEGGETIFPKINKIVKPEKGKAVIFKNVNDNGVIIKQALHGGEPIKSGEKWIANKWIRMGI